MGWLAGWTRRKKITISTSWLTAPLSDVTLTVKVPYPTGAVAWLDACRDVRFTTSDGASGLLYELRSSKLSANAAVFCVRVPSVPDTSDLVIYIYWGKADAPVGSDPANAWSSDYLAVYHFSLEDRDWPEESGMVAWADAPEGAKRDSTTFGTVLSYLGNAFFYPYFVTDPSNNCPNGWAFRAVSNDTTQQASNYTVTSISLANQPATGSTPMTIQIFGSPGLHTDGDELGPDGMDCVFPDGTVQHVPTVVYRDGGRTLSGGLAIYTATTSIAHPSGNTVILKSAGAYSAILVANELRVLKRTLSAEQCQLEWNCAAGVGVQVSGEQDGDSYLPDLLTATTSVLEPTVTTERSPSVSVELLGLTASVLTPTAGPVRSAAFSAPTLSLVASVLTSGATGQQNATIQLPPLTLWADTLVPAVTAEYIHNVAASVSLLTVTSSLVTPVTDQSIIAEAAGGDDADVYHRITG